MSRVYVMLGRAGDVINFLPVLFREWALTGEPVALVVGAEFAPLLEGVSYARPIVWPGDWRDCLAAVAWAKERFPDQEIVNAAVCGFDFHFRRECAAFDREAWHRAGAIEPWGRSPIVFDRRVSEREHDVWKRIDGPVVGYVVACFSGVSAPFRGGAAVLAGLRAAGVEVVDVSDFRAHRIFDLLMLLEHADALVTSDCALLHVAAAVPELPIVSLIPDQSPAWNRASWRPQHVARIYYSEATVDPLSVAKAVIDQRPRRFRHVVCPPTDPGENDRRRMAIARKSWDDEASATGCWDLLIVDERTLKRTAKSVLGDPCPCPFHRELIDRAAADLRPRDVIVLSNADVGVTPGFTGWTLEAIDRCGAVYTHRWDYDVEIRRPLISEAEVRVGGWYPGTDCWAFTKAWWISWGARFPDMVLGREAGDMVLRQVIKSGGGVEIPGAIWHERHASRWEAKQGHALPGNVYNVRLAHRFLAETGGEWNDWVNPTHAR